MKKVHVQVCLHIPTIKSTVGNKIKFLLNPFLISKSRFLILAEAFRNNHVAACSTALCSATEKNEMGGYVTFPCSSKMTQRSSTADWTKTQWRHRIGCDGTHTEEIFTFKVTLCNYSYNKYCKHIDTVNLDLYYCTNQFKIPHFDSVNTGELPTSECNQ